MLGTHREKAWDWRCRRPLTTGVAAHAASSNRTDQGLRARRSRDGAVGVSERGDGAPSAQQQYRGGDLSAWLRVTTLREKPRTLATSIHGDK